MHAPRLFRTFAYPNAQRQIPKSHAPNPATDQPAQSPVNDPTLTTESLEDPLNEVAREQKVGYALADGVLVPAVPARELPLDEVRLHEQLVEVRRELLVRLEGLGGGGLLRELGEAELRVSLAFSFRYKEISSDEHLRLECTEESAMEWT